MSNPISEGRVRSIYQFIKGNRHQYSVQMMCRVLGVAPSGYYLWLQQPLSNRALEDARLLRLIRASFTASQGIYGAPRVFLDLREAGETCSKHRVARLMRQAKLRALHGYRIRRWTVGKPSVVIPNLLKRQFTVTKPNFAWVTDITYIRTWQGWLYLAVVMDLFSRSSSKPFTKFAGSVSTKSWELQWVEFRLSSWPSPDRSGGAPINSCLLRIGNNPSRPPSMSTHRINTWMSSGSGHRATRDESSLKISNRFRRPLTTCSRK